MIDSHVHSVHSGDSAAGLREMCARAVEIGLSEIAFTEHLDFTPTDISYKALSYPVWLAEVNALREVFEGRLVIRAGVEVDYQDRYRSQIEDYLSTHEFDYILGAAHYVDGVIMEDHHLYFPGKDVRDAYLPYFEAAHAAVESGLFDVLAHLDLCKRHGVRYYGPFRLDVFHAEVEGILKSVVQRNMAIEINTSGLRKSPGEPHPAIETLRLYKSLGGSVVTAGSDAHRPEHLGFGLQTAYNLAGQAGLRVVSGVDVGVE